MIKIKLSFTLLTLLDKRLRLYEGKPQENEIYIHKYIRKELNIFLIDLMSFNIFYSDLSLTFVFLATQLNSEIKIVLQYHG